MTDTVREKFEARFNPSGTIVGAMAEAMFEIYQAGRAKPIPDLTDIIAALAYTPLKQACAGLIDVTATIKETA
jgi:hypothetical protein